MNLPEWDRRQFLQAAGALGLAGAGSEVGAAEPPPETKRIRLLRYPPAWEVACVSPAWIAEELLHAEGFEEVQYVPMTSEAPMGDVTAVASAEADINQTDGFNLPYSL